jgi:hypothetical protein
MRKNRLLVGRRGVVTLLVTHYLASTLAAAEAEGEQAAT